MHSDEGQDFTGLSTGILDYEVSSVGLVGDVVDEQRSAAGVGAVWAKDIEHVAYNPVLLRDELRWVILDEL